MHFPIRSRDDCARIKKRRLIRRRLEGVTVLRAYEALDGAESELKFSSSESETAETSNSR